MAAKKSTRKSAGKRTSTSARKSTRKRSSTTGRTTTKKRARKYGEAASKRVESTIRRYKKGTLKSGKGGAGGKVKSREQAIAIGLSEAREKGAKVPRKRASSSKES